MIVICYMWRVSSSGKIYSQVPTHTGEHLLGLRSPFTLSAKHSCMHTSIAFLQFKSVYFEIYNSQSNRTARDTSGSQLSLTKRSARQAKIKRSQKRKLLKRSRVSVFTLCPLWGGQRILQLWLGEPHLIYQYKL